MINQSEKLKTSRIEWRVQASKSRRRGIAAVYAALAIVVFLGVATMSVDMGYLFRQKARAQQAADAAALAGAFRLANFDNLYEPGRQTGTSASAQSVNLARLNGYDNANTGVEVIVTYPWANNANWYHVVVARQEPTFFSGIFRVINRGSPITRRISAGATALYSTLAPLNVNGGGVYGSPNGPANLSIFGPDGRYSFGDCYSTRTLNNGTPNPLFAPSGEVGADGKPIGKGYDFTLNIPANMGDTALEIYDPDCYNAPGTGGNQNDARTGERIDEIRRQDGGTASTSDITNTRYRLYADNGTPFNPNDDTLIWTGQYGNDPTTDMKWNAVFHGNRSAFAGQQFRLNVVGLSGGSENGFQVRAGPYNATTFNPNNGTDITAQGHLPMNFNTSGNTTITLGYVPAQAAGKQLQIRKFDTDVGGQSVIYTCDTLPNQSWPGVLSGDGAFTTDSISVPAGFTGGNWKATYTAGAQDTSVWDMSYTGSGPGVPGGVSLVSTRLDTID